MSWLRPATGAAAFGWLLTLWLFYPGFATFDTAHQWYEVRHGQYSNHHPPLMAMLWALSEPLLPGPGGPFVLQVSLYWGALAVLAGSLFRRGWAQVLAVLAVGLAPPLFGLLSHVWKDVALMAWLLVVAAVLVRERLGRVKSAPSAALAEPEADARAANGIEPAQHAAAPRRGLLLLALLALAVIGALRHNGLPAALPLVAYIAWRWFGEQGRPWRVVGVAALMFAAVVVAAQLPTRHPRVERVQFWPTLALWDLAAVSIAERQMLIPEILHKQPFGIDDLARHFQPTANVPLYSPSLFKVSLTEPYSAEESRQLWQAWTALPVRHTGAYLQHRLRLARSLVGLPATGIPTAIAFMPGHVHLGDNPPIHVPDWPLRDRALRALARLEGRAWVAAWPWLLASLALAALFARRLWRERSEARPGQAALDRSRSALGLGLLLSAWCYAGPLLILAASSQLRYFSASLAAIAVAALLALARDSRPDTRQP